MPGINVDSAELDRLAHIFQCHTSEFPICHLGLPLHLGKFLKSEWSPLIERFEQRLEGWKGNLLSSGGRVILLQAVLSNLPIFFLSLFKIPKGVLARINAIRKRFLWSGPVRQRKKGRPALGRDSSSKCSGGLGILNLEDINRALLSKWKWRWVSNHSLIWRGVIEARYRYSIQQIDHFPRGASRPSQIWAGILNATANFQEIIRWKVGNGERIRLWKDVWIGDYSFEVSFPDLFSLAANQDCTVNQCWVVDHTGGHWVVCLRCAPSADEADLLLALTRELQGTVLVEGKGDNALVTPKGGRPRDAASV
ncbi:hypothetical protein QJS04_geneDACA014463 [Acorus gramineus]|uniref:Uncharacterized protein n=1 Tax=Acorus gramineus TaxID=55184 RepID=A0AAV9BQI4_ACOGR|nr:hypothetical protein QJS04_geneDACA014463 [Acorus gramineus]